MRSTRLPRRDPMYDGPWLPPGAAKWMGRTRPHPLTGLKLKPAHVAAAEEMARSLARRSKTYVPVDAEAAEVSALYG